MYVYTARYGMGGGRGGIVYAHISKEVWNFKTLHKSYNFTYFKGCSDVTMNIHIILKEHKIIVLHDTLFIYEGKILYSY